MSSPGYFAVLALAVGGGSAVLTGVLRRYALAHSLIDVPNARSSHQVPTPRGGGVAIVLGMLAALPVLFLGGALDASLLWALAGAGGLVAAVGFFDDHGHVAARWRLLAHFAGAAWALAWLGGSPPLSVFGGTVATGWAGAVLAAVYLVWVLNLYNFMDGIDGIAGVEAICVCVGGAALYALSGQMVLAMVPLALAAAVTGFLCWNFPPAKIFMGDAGSGFLGIVLGVLSLHAGWISPELLWGWLILLGVFVVDATWTLLRRLVQGRRIYEAHRSHAYQHAARRFGRHLPVTLFICATNLFWLLPLALAVGAGHVGGLPGIAIAYAPLFLLAVALRAGEEEGCAA
ncbi:glycosyltransferase family 4 protein [Azoarcus sp. CIB]|uniref:MraY family glycosyltransferase n=1 Tax=Aromatoleum sp. (strain CIB) TaxID=198107 RepID=UPI00067BFDE3|nr:glycosyltransferase family 4 protein [Azoarcus sp. CIB]